MSQVDPMGSLRPSSCSSAHGATRTASAKGGSELCALRHAYDQAIVRSGASARRWYGDTHCNDDEQDEDVEARPGDKAQDLPAAAIGWTAAARVEVVFPLGFREQRLALLRHR